MNKRNHISVAIPAFEMNGMGPIYLKESFDILCEQTFKDFDVVVSDESKTDVIKAVCDEYKDRLDIKYFKNPEGKRRFAENTNYAIKMATGKIIKILLLDDFPYGKDALKNIADNFDLEKDGWLVTACEHSTDGKTFYQPFYPKYSEKIYLGKNTISSPSVLSIKNEKPLFFDVNLIWFVDCDYYKRCFDKFGHPKIVNEISVVNRINPNQTTHTVTWEIKDRELMQMLLKYHSPNEAKRMYRIRRMRRKIFMALSKIKKIICS